MAARYHRRIKSISYRRGTAKALSLSREPTDRRTSSDRIRPKPPCAPAPRTWQSNGVRGRAVARADAGGRARAAKAAIPPRPTPYDALGEPRAR